MRKSTTIFLLLVFSPIVFLLRKSKTMLSGFLRTRKRRQRVRAATAAMLVVAMLIGLIGLPERVWAAGYTWTVINPGAKQEVVCIGKGRWDDGYYKLISFEEAIKRGAVGVHAIKEIPDKYVAEFPREAYNSSYYQPITGKLTREIIGEDWYVVDKSGNKLPIYGFNTGASYINFHSSPHDPVSAKAVAKLNVNGIKGYTKPPKKATLNALVLNDGYPDERNFVEVISNAMKNWNGTLIDNEEQANLYVFRPGYQQVIGIKFHNDSKTKAAKDVRVKCSKIPKTMKKGEIVKFKVTVSGSNLSQSPITNILEFVAPSDISLSMSAEECFGMSNIPKATENKFLKNIFSKKGALVGQSRGNGSIAYTDWPKFDGTIDPDDDVNIGITIKVTK